MTKIIGHRGAAGVAFENSLEAIGSMISQNIDVIEFDIRLTKDSKLVVLHDKTTNRVADISVDVAKTTYQELSSLKLRNGQAVPILEEVLEVVGNQSIYIDIKDKGCASEAIGVLKRYPKSVVSFVSFDVSELEVIHSLNPNIPVYVLQHSRPLRIIKEARRIDATGIGINKWVINPVTYFLAQKYSLSIYVYVVNSRLLAWFLKKLYPKIDVCTDYPERFKP